MGLTAISFQEIQAYNDLTKSQLSPSEAIILKQMSVVYVRQNQDKNPAKTAPYKLPSN